MLDLTTLIFPTVSVTLSPHMVELLGSLAAVCTTASLVPQLMRVWRRKSAQDISLGMFSMFSLGVALWLIYGILIGSRPVEAANAVTLVLSLAILVLKLRYDRRPLP